MASSKTALKTIKSALDGGNFEKAAEQAEGLLKQDAVNHTALLFLGFAREKLGDLEAAENVIQKAAKLKPHDVQAYKGLITLFDKQAHAKVDAYHDTARQLAEIYAQQDDRMQCQAVVDKYELFAKRHGSGAQYRKALELVLPTSSLYPVLEGRVMQPGLAYLRILESAEADEREWINTQIGERRTRLGAKVDQVTRQVKGEAILKFQIEDKYAALIDWTRDDDARHDLEGKLFQRMYDNLLVLPAEQKPQQRDNVLNMANGMVIIRQPFPLAWKVALEWVDAEDLEGWDVHIFREYISLFPDDGLSKVLRGFLASNASPFPQPPPDPTEDGEPTADFSEAEQLILMNEGLDDCPDSLLGHRIVALTYLHFEDWQGAVDMARKAQALHTATQRCFATNLQNSIDGVNLILAKALIPFQSPRHHPEAKELFHDILSRKPKLTPALLGVGLIFAEDEDYAEAVKFMQQAAERDPDNVTIKLEFAWCRAQNGELGAGLHVLQDILSAMEADKTPNLTMKSIMLYRIAFCLWYLSATAAARKDKTGPYQYLIASIKANPSYAPAYTLLGIYFQDYGKSKQRARVALQKAFELSTSELEAAHRLAKAFADAAEWDLVELVAQRVVASGKAKPAPGSKKKAHSWPYAALGVVQMNKQQFSQAIVSFQAALRISPDDYYSWVGLGESYHNAGRHVASTKAFAKAESIDHGLAPAETWFAKYMLANVQREMGFYNESITAYREVLTFKSDEFGVLTALLQTTSESAWAKVDLGMFGEAVKLANEALDVADQIAQHGTEHFNLWKAVGDVCSIFAHVKVHAGAAKLPMISSLLQISLGDDLSVLADTDKTTLDFLDCAEPHNSSEVADKCLVAAILAQKRAIHSSSADQYAQAVAWYNLGWAEYHAYISGGPTLKISGKPPRRFLKAALKSFKRAIEMEAGNSEFWNALGVVTMNLSPKVSQHSFVRSLHLNDHSARTWTDLGALYLLYNDTQLANEAFTRAQSEDPEYADAWIGQGLLAMLVGHDHEARGLFMHAFDIADSSRLPSKRYYATTAFDHLLKDPARSQEVSIVLQPLFALRQYHTQLPADLMATHLMALLAERAGDHATAVQVLQEICDAVEIQYEQSESTEHLVKFAQAKSDLARAQLACGSFVDAVSSAETALDLSGDADELGPAYATHRQKMRLSAHLSAGLAHSHLQRIEQSIKMFQAALEEAKGEPDVVCMLAQVLWAKGGPADKEAARTQLFDVIENHPGHIQATALLAVTGLLDDDQDVLDAVEEDLKSLRRGDDIGVLNKIKVTKILAGIVGCRSQEARGPILDQSAVIADALNGIMLAPGQPQGWAELAQCLGTDVPYAAQMALLNAQRQVPPGGRLAADDLAQAYEGTGELSDQLKARMLAPWRRKVVSVAG